jgi:Zn-dependent peptidase ImmA (M78 family)/DNA-binding XRE family transcriptional regulator
MTALEQIAPAEIGERLRIAREAARMIQSEAAEAIGLARTTLVAIEQGQRRIRMNELQQLAKLYGTSVNALLRKESIHVDLVPRFRRTIVGDDKAADNAADTLARLAKAEVELENLVGVKRSRNYPPERPILPGDVRIQAEQDAAELRERLGLGIRPVSDLVTLLEMEVGVRIYVRRLDSHISGLFAFDEALGPCMLLNANHPRERRNYTAAHETAHFISTRAQPDVLHLHERENSREERYANTFARALLTPARAVMQKFHELTGGERKMTRRHVIVLAHFFGVSREAMVRRLEELKLVKAGAWDWFEENGGITDQQVQQVLGDLAVRDTSRVEAERPTTLRLNLLSAEVYRRGLLSEGQLARLLDIDRVELREIVDSSGVDQGMDDETVGKQHD